MGARIRLILNGKAAQDAHVREAVQAIREEGHQVEVRVTWEEGDAERLVAEAADAAARGALDHLVAGGGDGTVNQVFAAAFETGLPERCTLGLLPLGTANDFAQSADIPASDPLAALRLVLEAPARRIDLGLLDGRPFVNLVSGGFGAQVTAETNARLKSTLGAFAYVLSGLSRVKELNACAGRFEGPDFAWEGAFMAFAIGNGRQAGGGIVLCPDAQLDDGLLDLTILPAPETGLGAVAALLKEGAASLTEAAVTARIPWIRFVASEEIAINLDGEPIQCAAFRAECRPGALAVHLGPEAALEERTAAS